MVIPTLETEKKLWKQGYHYIAGIDEVGRGCFAGPVVVGAVIFPQDVFLPRGLADSKLLKPRTRERLAEEIKRVALSWAVGEISVAKINKFCIGKATQMAFRKAIKNLSIRPDFVIIDAFYNFNEVKIASSAYVKHLNRKRQKPIKDGDKICASISAASIVAKVYRDNLMKKLHQKYPYYGLSKHKGYGTKQHQEAIRKHGLSRIHRKSFHLQKFL